MLRDYAEDTGVDLDTMMLAEVSVGVVTEFVKRRRQEGVSNATINRDLTAFNHLFRFARNKDWEVENAVARFEKQGMKEGQFDFAEPSLEDIERLAERAPGTLRFLPLFLRATGNRVTETTRARWSDVEGFGAPDGVPVKMYLRHTKGGRRRTIVLPDEAVEILKRIPRSNRSDYIFWNGTDHGFYQDASNLFWQYGQETAFRARLHDLRHAFALEKLREGWSIYRVSRHLGHRSVLTTERYYLHKLTDDEIARVSSDGDNGI